ncbi:uncharacterized protein LOC119077983 [Bradysia coprophila]|uniref:uncharacterized protein LOC119077983 n=1 Tax=Bradysia coprophila TaxID=38358 RepID=UPI00187D91D7|nr:uncharacterized protein LOC119077983 [Bradysia coprophila]
MRVIIPESSRKSNDQDSSDSIISKRHNDCLPCRLVSGFGIIGIGGYIYSQAKHRPAGVGRNLIISTALVASYIGVARLTQLYPFDKK